MAQNLDGLDIRAITWNEPTDTTIRFTWHQVHGEEFIDGIAYDYYGDSTLWWVIANANPEILDYSVLPPGTLLRIPGLPGVG
jgi:nucleoid-associated protein YgaU